MSIPEIKAEKTTVEFPACVVCTDKFILGQIKESDVNSAYTIAPLQQNIQVGPSQVAPFMVPIPMCLECRRAQLRPGSNGKLIQA